MASLDISSGNNRRAGSTHRQKKLSTKVDLTPMVDLGFLLITFFIITTSLLKPKVMQLAMPTGTDSTHLNQNSVLTILAGRDNKIFYYPGLLADAIKEGSYGITSYALHAGIGDAIRQKQMLMDRQHAHGRKDLMLLIKPTSEASYGNLVKLLDETLINVVNKYTISEVTAEEAGTMNKYNLLH